MDNFIVFRYFSPFLIGYWRTWDLLTVGNVANEGKLVNVVSMGLSEFDYLIIQLRSLGARANEKVEGEEMIVMI